jgi:hypothetical protein
MSRTYHRGERRIYVKGVRRQPADLRKLARALIALAAAEADAAAEHRAGHTDRNVGDRGGKHQRPSADEAPKRRRPGAAKNGQEAA